MTPRPFALLEPTLGNVMAGRCTRLCRVAAGSLGDLAPGGLLWLREAFHLNARFDGVSPTTALMHRAWPAYAHDFWRKPVPEGLGKRRSARELKREWHRAHLVVTAVARQPLQAITEAEARAEGYRDRFDFAVAWNTNNAVGLPIGRGGRAWEDDPEVIVFDVRFVAAALPPRPHPDPRPKAARPVSAPDAAAALRQAEDNRAAARRALAELGGGQSAPARARQSALLKPVALTAPSASDRSWCDQCQRLVAIHEGRACGSPFCPISPAELAA
jgi:hypothetical protein